MQNIVFQVDASRGLRVGFYSQKQLEKQREKAVVNFTVRSRLVRLVQF
jgi:hypothetical protein